MNQAIQLTTEQQFGLAAFKVQVAKMSREQAQDFLVKLYEQMAVREAIYKNLLKHQWGIETIWHYLVAPPNQRPPDAMHRRTWRRG